MFLYKHIKNKHKTKKAAAPNHAQAKFSARFSRLAMAAGAVAALAPAPAMAGFAHSDYGNSFKKTLYPRHHQRIATSLPINPGAAARLIPASLGGMARTMPYGIYAASASVTTGCFNPRMVSLLKTIQKKYRRPLIITSGYRSPAHNIRAGGVEGSLHIACAAADIKIPGVNKYQLASYVRSLPNRGGVGLYCHNAVHVDIGTPRQWNWCSARKPRRPLSPHIKQFGRIKHIKHFGRIK